MPVRRLLRPLLCLTGGCLPSGIFSRAAPVCSVFEHGALRVQPGAPFRHSLLRASPRGPEQCPKVVVVAVWVRGRACCWGLVAQARASAVPWAGAEPAPRLLSHRRCPGTGTRRPVTWGGPRAHGAHALVAQAAERQLPPQTSVPVAEDTNRGGWRGPRRAARRGEPSSLRPHLSQEWCHLRQDRGSPALRQRVQPLTRSGPGSGRPPARPGASGRLACAPRGHARPSARVVAGGGPRALRRVETRTASGGRPSAPREWARPQPHASRLGHLEGATACPRPLLLWLGLRGCVGCGPTPRGGTPRLGAAQAEAPGAEVAERKQAGASRLGLRGGGPPPTEAGWTVHRHRAACWRGDGAGRRPEAAEGGGARGARSPSSRAHWPPPPAR